MGDQTLHTAQRLCEREPLHSLDKPPYLLDTSSEFEAQHSAKPALLRFGDRGAGMRCQPRIVGCCHLWMLIQICGDCPSCLSLTSYPGKQRAQAVERQIGVEGRACHAGDVGPLRHLCDILSRCRVDCAADYVGMSVQVLRG